MSLSVVLADEIVAALNGQTWQPVFTAQRHLLPDFSLKDLRDLKVTVVPRALELSTAARSLQQTELQIDIGIQQKIGAELEAEVTGLLSLTEQIATFLQRRCFDVDGPVLWLRTRHDPLYSREHLAEQRVFTSVLTLTYQYLR